MDPKNLLDIITQASKNCSSKSSSYILPDVYALEHFCTGQRPLEQCFLTQAPFVAEFKKCYKRNETKIDALLVADGKLLK